MIRPQPTRWFEIVVAHADAFIALEALAAAGCVEIEWHAAQPTAAEGSHFTEPLRRFAALARRYRPYWPPAATHLAAERRTPLEAFESALQSLADWGAAAEATIAELQRAEATIRELRVAEDALRAMAESRIDFSLFAHASQGVTASLFALPMAATVDVPADLLTREAPLREERLILAVGAPESIEALARAVAEASGRRARFPDWMQPTADANLRLAAQHVEELTQTAQQRRAQLTELAARHGIARALGTVARATWCAEHGGAIAMGDPILADVLARITGWTEDADAVVQAIERSSARAIVRLPPTSEWPRGARPPLVLRNPWWARPFELFTRLLGMPAANAADPSMLLAFAVPLMFGYMFGDLGQGLVLVAAGFALRSRWPALSLLVPGGFAAAAFGLVFGSVFCLEDLIHPLWVAPLASTLQVLIVPLVGGAALLALGLLIGLAEAWWQGLAQKWFIDDAPLLVTYVGVVGGLFHPLAWALVPIGVAWAFFAAPLASPRSSTRRDNEPSLPAMQAKSTKADAKSAAQALGVLVEKTLQILINTLSFARVGAFALAHAGLASAVTALAAASDSFVVRALVLVLGNALILVIEGLVVSIQTTRLVLFEFFTRFFKAAGREFRPLARPPVTIEES